LKKIYQTYSFDCVSQNAKLELYKEIKHNYIIEPYLSVIKNSKQRQVICQLRTSSHKLPVETGRYTNTPRNMRLCPLCQQSVGDEKHLILECTSLDNLRSELLQHIASIKPNITKLDKTSLLRYLMMFHDVDLLPGVSSITTKMYIMYKSNIDQHWNKPKFSTSNNRTNNYTHTTQNIRLCIYFFYVFAFTHTCDVNCVCPLYYLIVCIIC
jgi:hypothetical protein